MNKTDNNPDVILPGRVEMNVPQIRFNCGTTLQSPCFWLLLGAGAALAVMYFLRRYD